MQQLIEKGEVLVNGAAAKASLRLRGDEQITIAGAPARSAAAGDGGGDCTRYCL